MTTTQFPPSEAVAPAAPREGCRFRGLAMVSILGAAVLNGSARGDPAPAPAPPIVNSAPPEHADTSKLAKVILNSIKGYYTEYSKYPIPQDFAGGEAKPMRTDAAFTAVLLGQDKKQNPRLIIFLPDLKAVEADGGNGLKVVGEMRMIVDRWGEPFYVIMDSNYDGEFKNPNGASATTTLHQAALIWSAGPDKDPSTWEDNITSWTIGAR